MKRNYFHLAFSGLVLNRQSIFDVLEKDLIRDGDVEKVRSDIHSGRFRLIEGISTTTRTTNSMLKETTNFILQNKTVPPLDNIYRKDVSTRIDMIPPVDLRPRPKFVEWFDDQRKNLARRSLVITSILFFVLLIVVLIVVIRSQCRSRHKKSAKKKSSKHYAARHSLTASDARKSKKHVPKLLRYLHTNQEKPTSFRLSQNSKKESYQMISSSQEPGPLPYRNSDCVLSEHCCIHSSFSQPVNSTPSAYQEINRLMLSGSEPPLPIINYAHIPLCVTTSNTTRSIKKELDQSSSQTYSAVYSCELASNFDLEQDSPQKSNINKRRSILKNSHPSPTRTKIVFLYVKNLVDCYAIQSPKVNSNQPTLLAIADENRIQLFQAFVRILV